MNNSLEPNARCFLVNEVVNVKLLGVNATGDMQAEEILEKISILA